MLSLKGLLPWGHRKASLRLLYPYEWSFRSSPSCRGVVAITSPANPHLRSLPRGPQPRRSFQLSSAQLSSHELPLQPLHDVPCCRLAGGPALIPSQAPCT